MKVFIQQTYLIILSKKAVCVKMHTAFHLFYFTILEVEGSAVSLIYETKKPSINEGFIEIRRNPASAYLLLENCFCLTCPTSNANLFILCFKNHNGTLRVIEIPL